MVLGATPNRIRKSILTQGILAGVIGFVVAIPIVHLIANSIADYLYQTSVASFEIYLASFILLQIIILISLAVPLISLIKEHRRIS